LSERRLYAGSRHRNGFKRAVSVLLATMSMASHRQMPFNPRLLNSECMVPCTYRNGISVRDLGRHVMRLSSNLVVPSAIAVLSIALLCGPSGPAASQAAAGSAAPLPPVTVEAPKQVARPHRPEHVANTAASRRTSSTAQTPSSTAQTPSAAPDSTLGKLAKLERASSSCNGGCETSVKTGNAPWVGCSYSAGINSVFSATCRDTLTYNTYSECMETKLFLGWIPREARWHCSGLLAGGKLAGEKHQVAELKRSGRR
jgi:hypothetical protein